MAMNCQICWLSDPHLSTIYVLRSLSAGRPFVDLRLREALEPLADQIQASNADWRSRQIGEDSSQGDSSPDTLSLIAATESAINELHPSLAVEMGLRQRPLRELWEAHGPGLLTQMSRLEQLRLPERAKVVTVLPIQGGGGEAIAEHRAVVIESVLANPIAEIPEILRLAWLLSQLSPGTDASLLIPSCLAAARELGIVHQDVEQKARDAWLAGLG